MVNEKQLKFVCTRSGCCCTAKNTIVNVTYQDILRIINGLGLNINEILEVIGFYIFDQTNSIGNQKRMVIFPIETEKGLAYIGLIKNSEGTCFFYDKVNKKCSIYDLRPGFCRTFPFSFRYENRKDLIIFYTEKAKEYCPGIGSEASNIDYDYWTNLGKIVLEDLNKNQIFIKNWNKKVNTKKILPSVKVFIKMILALGEN